MKKAVFLSIVIALSISVSHAQFFMGVKGGLSLATQNYNTSYKTMKTGMQGALTSRYCFNDILSLQWDINIIQKGIYEKLTEGDYVKTTMNYIQVPVLAHFLIGKDEFNFFIIVGSYGAYWLSGKENFRTTSDNTGVIKVVTSEKEINFNANPDISRIDIGISGGLGIKIGLAPRHYIFGEGRYDYGLYRTGNNYHYIHEGLDETMNRALSFSVGYLYRFGKLKMI